MSFKKLILSKEPERIGKFLVTGWGNTDSILNINCPKCGAPKEFSCQTPKGRRKFKPHSGRYRELIKLGYTLNKVNSIRADIIK